MLRVIGQYGPSIAAHREPGLAMGVHRLELAASDAGQPVANEDGQVWVACSGRLFDEVDVPRQLIQWGHQLAGKCDAEAWAHLYEDHGEHIFHSARGQYATSLWDAHERKLLLGRERARICPLYYAQRDGWLVWGSEIKALLSSGLVAAEPDPKGIDYALTFYAPGTSRTAFQGVSSLPPCHYLRACGGQVELVRYWDLDFPEAGQERRVANPETLVDELDARMRQAIRRRLNDGAPAAVYLSGGLDSSLVLALGIKEGREPLAAFTIGMSGAGPDERLKACEVAETLGCPLTTMNVKPRDLARAYPQLVRAVEFPDPLTIDASLLRLAEFVHGHGCKVVLTGEGADEALAGYHLFKLQKLHSKLNWHLGRLAFWLAGSGLRVRTGQNGWRRTGFRALAGVRVARQLTFELAGRSRETFYSERMWESLKDHSPFGDLDLSNDRILRWHPINQAIYVEYHTFLTKPSLTAASDHSVLGSSIETRPPFLDEDLVAFCASIHPDYKLRGWTGKWLLRRLGQRVLPRRTARRLKQGLATSLSGTFLGPQGPAWVRQLLSPESLRTSGYFDPAGVARILARRSKRPAMQAGMTGDFGLTAVIATQLWHHTFFGGGLADLPCWSPPESQETVSLPPIPGTARQRA